MRAQIAKYYEAIAASYWFLPSVMTLTAILFSAVTTFLDERLEGVVTERVPWLTLNTADGARTLLSTIAGSMITVAGVTFSITIAAVAYATSQLGPHLLGNFMRDRSNQITLGTFIATFIYCLLVLRTVQGVEDSTGTTEVFVPHLGVLVGLVLTLLSLGNLIYFIHHIPKSIHASEVVAEIGEALNSKLDTLFPSGYESRQPTSRATDHSPIDHSGDGTPAAAVSNGYITHIDVGGLISTAQAHQLVVRLRRGPGDFVSIGETIASVHSAGSVEPKILDGIVRSMALNHERTQTQDTVFLIQQLVEIAGRALSPGVNDPFTAINSIDWLGSALGQLGHRPLPGGFLYDEDGTLRLITPSLTFVDFASAMFDDLRPYVSHDRNAAIHTMGVLERLAERIEHPPYRVTILEHATALKEAAERSITDPRDLHQITTIHDRISKRY
ncbi:MAG: DUF2254 domain-containing protein [Pseudomonadota bacterium]